VTRIEVMRVPEDRTLTEFTLRSSA
jgi:hypothetical protein